MILGFAPRYARFTLAFLPSIMGLGSLHALSAAARSAMVTFATYTHRHTCKALNQPLRETRIALEKSFMIKVRGRGKFLNFFSFFLFFLLSLTPPPPQLPSPWNLLFDPPSKKKKKNRKKATPPSPYTHTLSKVLRVLIGPSRNLEA